jgi:hypothetical protein
MGMPSVAATAMLQCSFGAAPATLQVLPASRVLVEGKPAAAISDAIPAVNIATFGMCTSLANPSVASATSAAFGVLTPMPCVPAIVGPWSPGAAKTLVAGKPALTSGSTCHCAFAGVVTITMPGTTKTLAG